MVNENPKSPDKTPEKSADKAAEKSAKPEKAKQEKPAESGAPAAQKEGGKEGGAPAPRAPKAKRGKRVDSRGVAHVKASFNNTLVTITTGRGEVISVGSAGTVGFKGTRKSTPFAAQRAAEQAAAFAMRHGLREVEVLVKGAGSGRESAVRALSNSGLKVISIEDVTPLPHNGCRARKRRRV
jgi:small subunit ribosomal protein S11